MQFSPFNLNYLLAIAFSVLSFFALDTTMQVTTDTIVATPPDTSTTQETTIKISTSTDTIVITQTDAKTALETNHDISTSPATTFTTIVHSNSDTMTTTVTMDMASTVTNIVTSSLVAAPSTTIPDSSSKLTAIISSPLMTTGSSSTAPVTVASTDNVISPSTVTQDASSIEVATSSIFAVTSPWSAHDATSQSSRATETVQSPSYTSTFKSSLTNAENDTSTAYPSILSSITITSSVMVKEQLSLMSAHQTPSTAAEITTSPVGAISSTFTLHTSSSFAVETLSSSYTSDVVSASMSSSYTSDVVSASMSSSYTSDVVSASMSSSYISDVVSASMSSSYTSDVASASMSSSYTSDVVSASMSSSYISDVVSASMSSSYTSDVVSASMLSTPGTSATSMLTTPTFTGAVTGSSTQDITSTTAVNTTTPPVPTSSTTSTTMTSTLIQSTTKYPTTKPNREGVVFVFTFVINGDKDTFLNLWNTSLKENMTEAFNTSGLDGFQGVGPALHELANGRKRRQAQGTKNILMQANFSANVGTTPNLETHLRAAMNEVEKIINGSANLTLQEYETSIGNFVNSTSDVCNSASETAPLCGPLYDCRNNLCYYKCEAKQCGRNGLCYVLQQNAVVVLQCKCTSDDFYDYTGENCDQTALKTEWVVGITAGVCGLIVLILVVVLICISCSCCRRSKESLGVDRFEDPLANTSTNNVVMQQIVTRSSFRTPNLPDSHYNQVYQPEIPDNYNEKKEKKHPYDTCDSRADTSSLASIDTDTKYKIKRPQIVKQHISDQ